MIHMITKEGAECFVWLRDKSWFVVDKNGTIKLTDKAPEAAVISFEMWKKRFG